MYEGGDDAGDAAPADPPADPPADNEADKKEEISDEEAIKRAIERNKMLIDMAKKRAAQEHGMMDGEGDPDLTPERLNAAYAGPMRTKICCEFWLYGILYALIVVICDIYRQKNEDCGIPVILWCEIFFGICLLKTILVSFSYFGINSCSGACVGTWYIVASAIGILLIFAWVIYGYVIYFSEENEC